jgi:dimethylaniline monooxygenase (N-oxide forming)
MDIRPDTVIYATGYTQLFTFLDKESNYPAPHDADLRNVAKSGDESVAFIGYVRPGVGMNPVNSYPLCIDLVLGAIPPLAEMQAFFWISLIKNQISRPISPPHYHLLMKEDARIKYGVDYSSYMSTLAKDIRAAPGLINLWREYGIHVLLCYWCVTVLRGT